ncbi:breast cancer type 2 susceptibility protein homolog [Hylaeus volcanicus]|uniref:breast cancer type 2 susceptibility protein homolog n=1 Tax=Hylaeus volcanicus TaxID=313075 RepID=UPI0023B79100|nr:breast cancer type 2 susceptibility protein homolog [Hylaeus volcanicus]
MGYKVNSVNMNFNNKNVTSTFGFTTAGGSSIKVSHTALSKAQQLFKDELNETVKDEEASKFQIQTKIPDAKVENTGFQMLNGESLETRNGALLKGVLHSAKIIDNKKNAIVPSGFKTASGRSIDISDEVLSKAVQQFEDNIEAQTNEFNMCEINNKFQITDEMLFHKETIESSINAMPLIGFSTAGGSSINVSKKALTKAKQLFANDLEDAHEFEDMHVVEEQLNKQEIQVKNIGFQTASGQDMNISEEALLKAKTLFNEETLEDFESSTFLTKSLQKRKIKDLDEDVPVNKQVPSNQFKKLRFSGQFEIQRNVHKNVTNTENQNHAVPSKSIEISIATNDVDKLVDNIQQSEMNSENNEIDDNCLISHEIIESAAALLADEKSSDSCEQWISPVENMENRDVLNVPSSPVIGGQFIPKKRKSIMKGKKKKSLNGLKNKKHKSVHIEESEQLNDNCVNSNHCMKEETDLLTEKQEFTNKEEKVVSDFGDTQLMMFFMDESANILEKRLEAGLEQDRQIKLKETNKPKPTISVLYFHRKTNRNNRVSWREISKGGTPILCTYEELVKRKFPPEILDVTADNAEEYKFQCKDFYEQDIVQNNIEGIQLEDGAHLILDENGYVGITNIRRSFLASPGVDPKLIPTGWVENHYKWIVWKLASMDRIKFTSVTLPRALTPARVMMELKYRYDREIDRSERSALRKILEKDDVASKRIVLCVSCISDCEDTAILNQSSAQLKTSSKKVVLTDGWYSVQAFIDQAMIQNVISGKVKEGTKLMIYGSELLNSDQGCSPLEVPENVCLKIHTNSTRRARWDTKLGYIAPSGPMCIKLKSICPKGGLIGKIKVLIARVYPILYYEKTASGESIFRNARCEEKANIAYEKEYRSIIEAFYTKAETNFSTRRRKNVSNPDSIDLAAIDLDEDCERLSKKEFITKQEQEQLINKCRMKEESLRQKLESRLQESLPPPRQVTPVLKIRVIEEESSAILSIWSPNEELPDILKEGNYVSICNITSLAKRGNESQLSTSRNTLFNRINDSNIIYPRRIYTALCDINKSTFAPTYGEFDTVGIVVSIGNEPNGMKNFESVYFAYPSTNSESSYLSVLFWNGIATHGYAEILTVGSFVACSNLEWRRATSWNIPIAYCTERSTFTRNPRQNHLQQPFEDLKRLIMDNNTYITKCAAEILEEAPKKSITRMSDHYTPDRNIDKFLSKENSNYSLPELSRRSLTNNETVKSASIQRRLEKLQYYGEPSSLSPIVLKNSSKRVLLDFQSPVRSSSAKPEKAQISLSTKFAQNPR